MPAHLCDISQGQDLLRLLLALVSENGGELRVKASSYDNQDKKMLTVDFDKRKGQLLVRAVTYIGKAVVVTPEATGWTLPVGTSPLERARSEAAAASARRHIPSDEELADMEDKAQKDQALAKAEAEGKVPIRLRTVPLNQKAD